jgi:hypothetical protein
MNKRPPTITALSWLYVIVGLVSTGYHISQFKTLSPTLLGAAETLLMIVIGLAAVAAGYYMLRGQNWARWLAFCWTLFHVILSAFQSPWGLIFHSVFVVLLALLLFSKEAKKWFTPTPAPVPVPQAPGPDATRPADPPPPIQ